MSRVLLWLILVSSVACGGEEVGGPDATSGFPDAAPFDLDAAWGECCYPDGGVPGKCPFDAAPGDLAGDTGAQCENNQYCGLNLGSFLEPGDSSVMQCCWGSQGSGDWWLSFGPKQPCFPYPAQAGDDALPDAGLSLAPHWGECCYADAGGVPGPCGATGGQHVQCSVVQYCGLPHYTTADGSIAAEANFGCCGDRFVAGAGYSPIDPSCPPVGADGGP